ncbi:hypothetical protein J5I95_13725 [Candidatus Poribacteria bacterium]|nr:hypothetical protein [Candidatus Poribacteria bacterium]
MCKALTSKVFESELDIPAGMPLTNRLDRMTIEQARFAIQHGDAWLSYLCEHRGEMLGEVRNLTGSTPSVPKAPCVTVGSENGKPNALPAAEHDTEVSDPAAAAEVYQLFNSGVDITEIANRTGLTRQEVTKHLSTYAF